MADEHDEVSGEQEFPPLDDDTVVEEVGDPDSGFEPDPDPDLGYEFVPDPVEDPAPAEPQEWDPEARWEAPLVPPGCGESEGVLFLPEDDPLQVQPPPVPAPPVQVQPKYVSKRLRHLISESPQPVYRDPSGRHPRRG